MKKVIRLSLLSALLFSAAAAGPMVETAEAGGQCRQEIQQFCGNVPRGQGQRRACIQQHFSQLSPQCQERIQERKARRQQRRLERQGQFRTQ